jgi:hypothetical protein
MKGWVMAGEEAFSDKSALVEWLNKAKLFVETLPAKN